MSQVIPLYPYNKNDRILFCLKYDITCRELVPPTEDIIRNFQFGESLQIQREAGSYLEMMGERAKIAEPNTVKVLRYIDNKTIDGMGSANLHEQCLNILGILKQKILSL